MAVSWSPQCNTISFSPARRRETARRRRLRGRYAARVDLVVVRWLVWLL